MSIRLALDVYDSSVSMTGIPAFAATQVSIQKNLVYGILTKVLIVARAKVDFLLLVFVVSADDDLYFVFQAEIHDIVGCLIEKVVDPAGSFL